MTSHFVRSSGHNTFFVYEEGAWTELRRGEYLTREQAERAVAQMEAPMPKMMTQWEVMDQVAASYGSDIS